MVLKVASSASGLNGPIYYQGTWDANANNPFLQSSVGFTGEYYIVSVAGNTNLNGITNWQVGDWAVFNGATNVWEKIGASSLGTTLNIVNDSTSNTTYNLALTNSSGGLVDTEYVDNGALTFNPSANSLNVATGNIAVSVTPGSIFLRNSGIYINNYDVDPDGTPPVYGQAIVMDGGWGGLYFNTANVAFQLGNASFAVNQFGAISVGPKSLSQLQAGNAAVGTAGQVLVSGGLNNAAYWATPANGTVVSINAGTGINASPNPITSTGTISIANTAVTAGSYGSANAVSTFTVNQQGQLTAAGNVTIAVTSSQVSGLGTMATQNANAVAITGGNIAVTYANSSYHIATANISASSNIGAYSYGNLSYSDVGVVASFANSANNSVQLVMQNTSSLSNASTDIAIVNDTGSAYIDVGIASSTYSGSGSFNKANGAYTYAGSTDLYLGTISNNAVHILANNSNTDAITVNANNTVTIPTLITGNAVISGGSINVQTTNHTATTTGNATYATSSLLLVPAGFLEYDLNGTVVKIPYYAV